MSPEKILSILKGINPSKAAGIDNLSSKFLKDDVHVLARPISQLCNLSIKCNSFPRNCKVAKAKPLFKKGSQTDPQTILFHYPCYQKLLKGLFMIKLKSFWVRINFCTDFSWVFEKTTLLTLDKITTGSGKDLFTGMVLVDLQKVFDTTDQQILLQKMKYLGFTKNTISWFNYIASLWTES